MGRKGRFYGVGYSQEFDKSQSPWHKYMVRGQIKRQKREEAAREDVREGERKDRMDRLEASLAVDPLLSSLVSRIGRTPDYSDPIVQSEIRRARRKDGKQ